MSETEMVTESAPETGAATTAQSAPAVTAEQLAAELNATRKALKEANKEAAERRKRLETFEREQAEQEQDKLSETEKLTKALQDAQGKLQAYERQALQRQAAEKVGLPASLGIRLQGETLEELVSDAQSLMDAMPKQPKPTIAATNPGQASQGETDDQRRARIYGSGVNIFDPNFARQSGGGVFINKKE
jgi:septal ring factor EnvC (AmiA/AmiB activator)